MNRLKIRFGDKEIDVPLAGLKFDDKTFETTILYKIYKEEDIGNSLNEMLSYGFHSDTQKGNFYDVELDYQGIKINSQCFPKTVWLGFLIDRWTGLLQVDNFETNLFETRIIWQSDKISVLNIDNCMAKL